jgi:hypothetical protein
MVDALTVRGDEGRTRLRKAMGSCQEALIHGFPNGTTQCVMHIILFIESERSEVKHLSSFRKRNQMRFRQ